MTKFRIEEIKQLRQSYFKRLPEGYDDGICEVNSSADETIYAVDITDGFQVIGSLKSMDKDELLRNARLFTSAPEALLILRNVENCLKDLAYTEYTPEEITGICESSFRDIREYLNKVEGGK